MSVSAAICGFRVSAQSRGHETTRKRVTICLLLSTFGASHGGGKACRLLGSESTVSLTTFCEAEDVHKKRGEFCAVDVRSRDRRLCGRKGGRLTPPRETRADDRVQYSSFLQVRIRYKTVCLPKSTFRHRP